jgi:hypothetical protein
VKPIRVAVLGAGIMGSSVALFLARKGAKVTLIDAAPRPFCGASRWNEGKIHLGFLYAADSTLETARAVIPGGLAFKQFTEELIGTSLDHVTTAQDDIYLVHRDSIVETEALQHYFEAVAASIREHPQASCYLVDVSAITSRILTERELDCLADTRYVASGFCVPERSVSTLWVADRFINALEAEPRIEMLMATRVMGVSPAGDSADGKWKVSTEPAPDHSQYDFVVNALWEGKLAVDTYAELKPEHLWSHRYRLAVFLKSNQRCDLPSAVIGFGPFGDIKNYTGEDFYLSWYPAGLVAEGTDIDPPPIPKLSDSDKSSVASAIVNELGTLLRGVAEVAAAAQDVAVEGGWVFAIGRGSLADARATIHRRYQFGVRRRGSYFSVDTGKYSVAPWLARQVADAILGE